MDPRLTARVEDDRAIPVLVWRFDATRLCISSGPLGGGIGLRDWVLNATVALDYDRRDPDRHLQQIGAGYGLTGAGCGLLTAVDVTHHQVAADGGVHATATVGLSSPAWAAAPDGHFRRELPPGTINIVVAAPVRLSAAALVNAVATATEAKVQALQEAGVRATGTASDAVVVHCPATGAEEAYGGPRSVFGARIARAVYAAVLDGSRAWIARHSAALVVGADGIEPPTAGV